MNDQDALPSILTAHLALCQQALDLVQQENAAFALPSPPPAAHCNQAKKQLLSNLSLSLDRLRRARVAGQAVGVQGPPLDPRLAPLIRANQDLMLRVLMLSRESERLFLERGLFSPRDLPAVQTRRPHFVADLYRRHSVS